MIYGNKFLPKKEESISVQEFGIESIAYNEYHNYKSLLEACTDESSKPVLEAQVQILYEVSFKDIIEKIKKAWNDFKEWVKGIWNKIFDKKKVVKEKKKKAEENFENFKKQYKEEHPNVQKLSNVKYADIKEFEFSTGYDENGDSTGSKSVSIKELNKQFDAKEFLDSVNKAIDHLEDVDDDSVPKLMDEQYKAVASSKILGIIFIDKETPEATLEAEAKNDILLAIADLFNNISAIDIAVDKITAQNLTKFDPIYKKIDNEINRISNLSSTEYDKGLVKSLIRNLNSFKQVMHTVNDAYEGSSNKLLDAESILINEHNRLCFLIGHNSNLNPKKS